MKNTHKAALARRGVDVERYYVEGWPPVWGLALKRGDEDVAVIESHGCHTDNDRYYNKYVTRSRRAQEGKTYTQGQPKTNLGDEIAVHKTQREAVAAAMRRGV